MVLWYQSEKLIIKFSVFVATKILALFADMSFVDMYMNPMQSTSLKGIENSLDAA